MPKLTHELDHFEHLSNSPQLDFLFVLKQIIQKGNLQGFGQNF